MNDTMFRKPERKYCLLTHQDVNVSLVMETWRVEDGSTEERTVVIECPNSGKCRRQRIDCMAVWPDKGKDPFTVEGNLLSDLGL